MRHNSIFRGGLLEHNCNAIKYLKNASRKDSDFAREAAVAYIYLIEIRDVGGSGRQLSELAGCFRDFQEIHRLSLLQILNAERGACPICSAIAEYFSKLDDLSSTQNQN